MADTPSFYLNLETCNAAILITRGAVAGRVALKIAPGQLLVVVTGEPTGESLVECFQAAMAQKLLFTDMRTLVDLRAFVGAVDWKAVFSLRHLAPWGEAGAARTAYLFKDATFDAAIKILGAMFARTRHRGFTDRDAAIQWLGEVGQ